jgi:hypothetical protein
MEVCMRLYVISYYIIVGTADIGGGGRGTRYRSGSRPDEVSELFQFT